MRGPMAAAIALLAPCGVAQGRDAPAECGQPFVGACLPEPLSYLGTRALAETLGWRPTERGTIEGEATSEGTGS